MRTKKRLLSLLFCGALLFSGLPATAFAEGEPGGGLCEHHPAHTPECGYTEGMPGTPCAFVRDLCNPKDSGEAGEQTIGASTPSNAEQNVTQDVQDMIDALPTAEELSAMDAAQQQEVYNKVQAAYDAYNALADEQKEQITGAEIFDSLFEVFNGMVNSSAESVGYISYTWDETENQLTEQSQSVSDYTEITAESAPTSWSGGWYVVKDDVTIGGRVTVTGTVHLILADDSSLTVNGGIQVRGDNSLNIYGQSQGSGELTAIGPGSHAGIGSNANNGPTGNITIHGGVVTARQGNSTSTSGAGIGGGNRVNGGTVVIYDGIVTATGARSGAGIGSGGGANNAGTVTIYGGIVKAQGGSNGGAGIGGGYNCAGGTVTIWGGSVTAIGGDGVNGSTGGAGIGSGTNSSSGGTFSTGTNGNAVIFAQGGHDQSIGIQDKTGQGNWRGIIFTSDSKGAYSGKVYGNQEIPSGSSLDIPEGSTFTIPEGVTLTNDGTLTNSGRLENPGTINGNLVNNGTLYNPGTINGKVSGTGTIEKVTQTAVPAAPSSTVSVTANQVELTAVTSSGGVGSIQYGYTTGEETSVPDGRWQSGTTFTGLTSGTAYTFYARYAGNDYYAPSAASGGLKVVTNATADSVAIDYVNETVSFNSSLEVNAKEDFAGTQIESGGSIKDYIKTGEESAIYVRVKADGGTAAGEAVKVTIPARPAAPERSDIIEMSGTGYVSIRYKYNPDVEKVEFRSKVNDGSFTKWQDSMSSSTNLFSVPNLHTSDSCTIEVRKKASDEQKQFCSEALTLKGLKPADPIYNITIPATVEVGSTANIQTSGSFSLGYEGYVKVGVKTGLNNDGTLTLTRENDTSTTLTSQMMVNGSEFKDLTQSVAEFNSSTYNRAVPIRFEAPTGVIPAGTYKGTVTFEITYVDPAASTNTSNENNSSTVTMEVSYTILAYAVTVNGSYAGTSGAGDYAKGATVAIDAGTRAGYAFTGWTSEDGVVFADAKSAQTTFTMLDKAVTVTANWAENSTGGGTNPGEGDNKPGGTDPGEGGDHGGGSGGNTGGSDSGNSGGNDGGDSGGNTGETDKPNKPGDSGSGGGATSPGDEAASAGEAETSQKVKKLTAPKKVTVAPSYNKVKVSWKKVRGAAGYQVYRSARKNGKYKKVKTTKARTWTNKKLKTGKTWYYKVRAYKKEKGKTTYSRFSARKKAKVRPAAPALKVRANKGAITAKWSSVAGATRYQLYRAARKNGKYYRWRETVKRGYVDRKKLRKGTVYYYKARAYRVVKGTKIYGKFSEVKKVRVK